MNTYSRALRHIDMADVKKKHQQKISEQKIQKRLEREERKYIQSVMEEKKCDWRKELNEGMTSSGTFFTTLPATGDTVLQAVPTNSEAEFSGDMSIYNSGINFGSDGFNLGNNYLQFSGQPNALNDRFADTFQVDTSTYTTVTINAISGSGSNGGSLPNVDLQVYWVSASSSGLLGYISKNNSSLTQYSFTLPNEARGKEIDIFFVEPDAPQQYVQYIGRDISIHPSLFNNSAALRVNNLLKNYPTFNINNGALTSELFAFWSELQIIYTGIFWPNSSGYPAPISGQKGTLVGGAGGGDYKAIYDALKNQLGYLTDKYPLTYGVADVSFQRKTPVNVFVPLDSPEATSFVRTEPAGPRLTPEQKKKQLKSQLKAGKQYTDKQFGPNFPGSNYVMPGDAGVTPGVMTYTFDRVTDSGTQKITKSVPYNSKQTSTTKSQPTSSGNTADRIYDLQRKIAVLYSQKQDQIKKGNLQQARNPSYYDDTISHFQKELDSLTKSSTTSSQSQQKPLTPQQNAALDRQIKDFQAQAEKNKQDAQNKQWAAAAQLGMDALTAATLLSPIPGDEAIVAAAQGAKLGPTAARGFAKANPGKYNPFLNQQTNKYLNLPRK